MRAVLLSLLSLLVLHAAVHVLGSVLPPPPYAFETNSQCSYTFQPLVTGDYAAQSSGIQGFGTHAAMTAAAWVRISDINQEAIIMTNGWTAIGGSFLLYYESVTKTMLFGYERPPYTEVYGATILQSGVWYHFAGVYDGAYIYAYLNGNLDGYVSVPGGPVNVKTGPGSGIQIGLPTLHQEAAVSGLLLYNTALSAASIAQLASTGITDRVLPVSANSPSLVAAYLFGARTINPATISDLTNHGNDLTVYGAPVWNYPYCVVAGSSVLLNPVAATTNFTLVLSGVQTPLTSQLRVLVVVAPLSNCAVTFNYVATIYSTALVDNSTLSWRVQFSVPAVSAGMGVWATVQDLNGPIALPLLINNPCLNGGTSLAPYYPSLTTTCACAPGFTGPQCASYAFGLYLHGLTHEQTYHVAIAPRDNLLRVVRSMPTRASGS